MKFTEIEYCPWCGGEIRNIHIIYRDVWYLICKKCGYETSKYPTWERARKQYEQDKAVKKSLIEGSDEE